MPRKPQKPPTGSVQLETLLRASALKRLQQEPPSAKPRAKSKPRGKKTSKA